MKKRRRPRNFRKFHNGPEIRTKSKNSKRLRGLKGWNSQPKAGPVRVIVRNGEVVDPARFHKITSPESRAESPVTARWRSGRGGVLANVNPVPPQSKTVNDGVGTRTRAVL